MQSDNKKQNASDLNLVYILGIFLNTLPLSLIQMFLRYCMKTMVENHRDLFTRLNSEEDSLDFIIQVKDLPFDFYMKTNLENPILLAIDKENNIEADAYIKSSLQDLLLMLEGKLDGDAAFFSKKLNIEGKTEHVVALRNALDSVEINVLEDLVAPLHAHLQKPVKALAMLGFKKYQTLNNYLQILKQSITGNIEDKINLQSKDIEEIKHDLYHAKRDIIKATRGPLRKKV